MKRSQCNEYTWVLKKREQYNFLFWVMWLIFWSSFLFLITNLTAGRPRCPLLMEWWIFPDHSGNIFIIVRISHHIAAKRNQSRFYLSVCASAAEMETFFISVFHQKLEELSSDLMLLHWAARPRPLGGNTSGTVFIQNFTFCYRQLCCWKKSWLFYWRLGRF